jgi:hypothetical protein
MVKSKIDFSDARSLLNHKNMDRLISAHARSFSNDQKSLNSSVFIINKKNNLKQLDAFEE